MFPAEEHTMYLKFCFQMSCDIPVLTVGELCSTRGVNTVQGKAVVHAAAIVLHGSWETCCLKGCHAERSSAERSSAVR